MKTWWGFFALFCFFFGHVLCMWKFLSQRSNLCYNSNPSHCSGNARSLTFCTTRERQDVISECLTGSELRHLSCTFCSEIQMSFSGLCFEGPQSPLQFSWQEKNWTCPENPHITWQVGEIAGDLNQKGSHDILSKNTRKTLVTHVHPWASQLVHGPSQLNPLCWLCCAFSRASCIGYICMLLPKSNSFLKVLFSMNFWPVSRPIPFAFTACKTLLKQLRNCFLSVLSTLFSRRGFKALVGISHCLCVFSSTSCAGYSLRCSITTEWGSFLSKSKQSDCFLCVCSTSNWWIAINFTASQL